MSQQANFQLELLVTTAAVTELVGEVDWIQQDKVGLALMNNSGTSLLETGWTLFHSAVVPAERCWAGVGILGACMYTTVNKKVAFLRLCVEGEVTTSVVK